jgi:hypothetical protein
VYSGLRLCIDTLAVICVVLGVSLFAGTKRETLWDRNNLGGLLLVGVALLTHGGLDTILRSSPRATFSGYVLGWSRSSENAAAASGWVWLYDLGYPPAKGWGGAPYRALYVPATPNMPNAVWNTDSVWLIRATYRTRDLQVVRIEAEPVPAADTSGMQKWTWQFNESLLRPAFEAAIGLTFLLGATIGLLIRSGSGDASLLHINPFVGDASLLHINPFVGDAPR